MLTHRQSKLYLSIAYIMDNKAAMMVREWRHTYRTGNDNVQQELWLKYKSYNKLIFFDMGPILSIVLSLTL